jgi:hypothetical protein
MKAEEWSFLPCLYEVFSLTSPGQVGGIKTISFKFISMFGFRYLEIIYMILKYEKRSCCLKTNENAYTTEGCFYSV